MENRMGNVKDQLEKNWVKNLQSFPFSGYIAPARKSAYLAMIEMMADKVNRNSRILDFGCGPMDCLEEGIAHAYAHWLKHSGRGS